MRQSWTGLGAAGDSLAPHGPNLRHLDSGPLWRARARHAAESWSGESETWSGDSAASRLMNRSPNILMHGSQKYA